MRTVAPLLVLTDARCALHDAGAGHPERPERLRLAMGAVAAAEAAGASGLRVVDRLEPVDESRLALAHTPRYVERLLRMSGRSAVLDPDTSIGPHSVEAARLAAQAAVEAVRAVLAGDASGALCLTRPPGHHAESARAMGFCVFNSAAVAAAVALADHGCRRILIFDPDVHHGNGTQEIFYERADVLYVSLHQYPWYPWISGAVGETGSGAGHGYTVNVPLPAGCGDVEYALAMEEVVLPVVRAWRPDLVIVSAGFDAHAADPLGGMRLSAAGLRDLFGRLFSLLGERGVPWAATLEGGYAPSAVRDGVAALLQPSRPEPLTPQQPMPAAAAAIAAARGLCPLLSSQPGDPAGAGASHGD